MTSILSEWEIYYILNKNNDNLLSSELKATLVFQIELTTLFRLGHILGLITSSKLQFSVQILFTPSIYLIDTEVGIKTRASGSY